MSRFLWFGDFKIASRWPAGYPAKSAAKISSSVQWGWRREKPLVIVLDNYSVHRSARFAEERVKWRAADIELFFLPSYSPELSGIEPVWGDVKHHRMRRLSRDSLFDLKRDVDTVLAEKAVVLAKCATSLLETA